MNHIMARMAKELNENKCSHSRPKKNRRRQRQNVLTLESKFGSASMPNIDFVSASSENVNISGPKSQTSQRSNSDANTSHMISFDMDSQLDPTMQPGETISLNKQRQRVATLMKLCRHQNKLAPVLEPIPGLFQKKFLTKSKQVKALAKVRDGGHAKELQQAQLPPKYQPTRELIIAMEEKKDILPKTVNEAMIGADATLGVLHSLFSDEIESSKHNRESIDEEEPAKSIDDSKQRNAKRKAGYAAMTDGILQKSYLVERFLEELEIAGNFEGNSNLKQQQFHVSPGHQDPANVTVISALRREVMILADELRKQMRIKSLLQMELEEIRKQQRSIAYSFGMNSGDTHNLSNKSKHTAAARLRKASSMQEMVNTSDTMNSQDMKAGSVHDSNHGLDKNKTQDHESHPSKKRRNAGSFDKGEIEKQEIQPSKMKSKAGSTRYLKRSSSVSIDANSKNQLMSDKAVPTSHRESQPTLLSAQLRSQNARDQGDREFQLAESKREVERKLKNKERELQRTNALMEAADAERKSAEIAMKKAQKRLLLASQGEDDMSHLIKSLHSEVAEAKSREQNALAALERQKVARLIGSTRTISTQTGDDEEGGVIGGAKSVAVQTDHSSHQHYAGMDAINIDDGAKNDSNSELNDGVRQSLEGKKSDTKRSKNRRSITNKTPKMSGKKWVNAAQYWQEKMPNGEGLLHFARTFRAKDVPAHSEARTMMLVRAVMEDKLRGDDHEREETMQEYMGEWSLNKYGLISISCKEHAKLLISIRVHCGAHERIRLFNRMVGISRAFPHALTNCVLYLWNLFRPKFDASNKERDKDDLSAYIATTYCVEAVDQVFGNGRPAFSYFLPETQRSKLVKRIWKLEKQAHHKSHGRHHLCASEVLELFVSEWELESNRVDQLLRALFEAADVNGDGELTLSEFRHIIEFVENTNMTGIAFSTRNVLQNSKNKGQNSEGAAQESKSAQTRPKSPFLQAEADQQKFSTINVVALYKSACRISHELADADMPADQITPQGFAEAMQNVFRGMPMLPALSSVPLITGDALKKAVAERWKLSKKTVEELASSVQNDTEKYHHLLTVMHRVDELCDFPADEYHQAAWILMDMIQARTWQNV